MRKRFLFPVLLLLTFCTDDKKVFEQISPLKTSVSDITEDGVTVSGEMTSAAGSVTDRGFYWTDGEYIVYKNANRKILGPGDANFSTIITSNMPKGKDILMSAYIKSNGITIHGTLIKFRSLGSSGVSISGFEPKVGKSDDIIVITGSGFSSVLAQNTIKLNDIVVPATFASSDVLKFAVPGFLATKTPYTLTVLVNGVTATAASTFEFDPGASVQITDTNKTAVSLCEDLEVTIVNTPTNELIFIFFNDAAAVPYARDGNKFRVTTPVLPLNTTSITLKVLLGSNLSSYPTPLTFNPPVVLSFSGALTAGSSVSVTAKNLPGCNLEAKVNGAAVALTNKSATHFDFVVPAGAGASFDMDFFINGSSTAFTRYNFH